MGSEGSQQSFKLGDLANEPRHDPSNKRTGDNASAAASPERLQHLTNSPTVTTVEHAADEYVVVEPKDEQVTLLPSPGQSRTAIRRRSAEATSVDESARLQHLTNTCNATTNKPEATASIESRIETTPACDRAPSRSSGAPCECEERPGKGDAIMSGLAFKRTPN